MVDVLSTEEAPAAPPPVPVPDPMPEPTKRHEAVPDGDGDGGGNGSVGDDGDEVDDEPKPRRLTWRVAVFVLALLLLIGIVLGALGWYARKTYYVTFEDEEVVDLQGSPGRVPVVRPDRRAADRHRRPRRCPDALVADLEEGVDQPTLEDAKRYVENLEDQIAQVGQSTTTTTTTTVTTTTTQPESRPGGGTETKPDGTG